MNSLFKPGKTRGQTNQIGNLVGMVIMIAILGIIITMLALVGGEVGDTIAETTCPAANYFNTTSGLCQLNSTDNTFVGTSAYNVSVNNIESLEVAGSNQTLLMWVGYISVIIALLFGIFAFRNARN